MVHGGQQRHRFHWIGRFVKESRLDDVPCGAVLARVPAGALVRVVTVG
jgi:hypothetical protein